VTNLLARRCDYATAGQNVISITDADSFWVDGYFAETGRRLVAQGHEIRLMSPEYVRPYVVWPQLQVFRKVGDGRIRPFTRSASAPRGFPELVASVAPIAFGYVTSAVS
jgi:hypothetical protein